MYFNNWKREILTVPNLLSLLRLVLIPVYVSIYLHAREPAQYCTAGAIIILSCLTDAADGIIARRCNMVSTLGKILDPLADKTTQLALTFCLSRKYRILIPILTMLLAKEFFQTALGIIHFLRGEMLPGALMTGKICTTVLFTTLIVLVLFPQLPNTLVACIALLDFCFLSVSLVSYIQAYSGKNPRLEKFERNKDLPN